MRRKALSLTVLATALTETGSRDGQLIFEEFKGTGNIGLHLDRRTAERSRLLSRDPSAAFSTRREELLYHPGMNGKRVLMLRRPWPALPPLEAMEKTD